MSSSFPSRSIALPVPVEQPHTSIRLCLFPSIVDACPSYNILFKLKKPCEKSNISNIKLWICPFRLGYIALVIHTQYMLESKPCTFSNLFKPKWSSHNYVARYYQAFTAFQEHTNRIKIILEFLVSYLLQVCFRSVFVQ